MFVNSLTSDDKPLGSLYLMEIEYQLPLTVDTIKCLPWGRFHELQYLSFSSNKNNNAPNPWADLEPLMEDTFPLSVANTSEQPTQESTPNQQPPSPPKPFPDFEPDLALELAQFSPTFPHEIDTNPCFNELTLLELADGTEEGSIPPGVLELHVSWVSSNGECEDDGDDRMREATGRALEWARIDFGETKDTETEKETMEAETTDEEDHSSKGDDEK